MILEEIDSPWVEMTCEFFSFFHLYTSKSRLHSKSLDKKITCLICKTH